jgi:alkylhydroperoxidase/carboxymuconolactone decarboxylase family protein YurZ
VEEVLHQGASDAEFAETLDIGLYMGGSLAVKSVRYAFQILEEVRGLRRPGGQP